MISRAFFEKSVPTFSQGALGLNGIDEKTAARPGPFGATLAHPGCARRQDARPHPQSAGRHGLRRPFHRAGVHFNVPGDRAARFRASGHRLRAWRMDRRIEIAEVLSLGASAITARSTRIAPYASARTWSDCSSRAGSGSGATGFRAAACPSTCSGRAASRRRGSGSPNRVSRPTAAAADGSATVRFSLSRPVCSKRRQLWPQELGDLPLRLIGCWRRKLGQSVDTLA